MEYVPHPPNFDEILGQGGATALLNDVRNFQAGSDASVRRYVATYTDIYSSQEVLRRSLETVVSKVVSPKLFEECLTEVERSFSSGMVLGLRAGELALNKTLFDVLSSSLQNPPIATHKPNDEPIFTGAVEVIKTARSGYQKAHAYHETMSSLGWDLEFVDEISREHFEFGFGYVFSSIVELARQECMVTLLLPVEDAQWEAFATDPMGYRSEPGRS